MATASQNVATIIAQAEILDGLISDFRAAKSLIDAAASEINKAQPGQNHSCHAGRLDLVGYAHSLMVSPSLNAGKSVEDLATEAWARVS